MSVDDRHVDERVAEDIATAMRLIREFLGEHGPTKVGELVTDVLRANTGLTSAAVKEALWTLLDAGTIDLSDDRKVDAPSASA